MLAIRGMFLLQQEYRKRLNAETRKDESAFFNNIALFVNLFLSDFVCSLS